MTVSIFGGTGRPNKAESERRRLEFVRLLALGTPFPEAAEAAKITPERALQILWEQRELCHLDEQACAA